mmetsp:Transcript_1317/g.2372  ORF Transcript_1317/g.2372 Transcript_1317/m.2372 type:complete len:363 (+) Transcript_1317:114-1202(+)
MFALRSPSLLISTAFRRAPKIPPAMLGRRIDCVSGTGTDNNNVNLQQQQVRNYGRTCPAVRGQAAKKKRAASSGAESSKTMKEYSTTAIIADAPSPTSTSTGGASEAMTVASIANLKVAMDGTEPTMEIAKSMPISFKSMDNISLLTLSALKVEQARAEMLRRHIMTVDNVPYAEACRKFEEIAAENRKGMLFHTIPYKLGITAALGGGVLSVPLCFHLPTVHWFNERFVTTDIPEPQDLETWLEVGKSHTLLSSYLTHKYIYISTKCLHWHRSYYCILYAFIVLFLARRKGSWAWNWMEPPLGQISFFLLCLQFARAQIANMGVRPYTARMKAMRAKKIVAIYPQYDATLLSNYSKSVTYY